jgi:hypothetical protein
MDLNHRLLELEKKMQDRLRRKAKADETWQWRYQSWREEGWPYMPPPDPNLTLDEFIEIWRQVHGPNNLPSRRSRRSPKSGDVVTS